MTSDVLEAVDSELLKTLMDRGEDDDVTTDKLLHDVTAGIS